MTNTEQQTIEGESDISLNDVIEFFVTKWKFLLIGTISGLLVALGGALLLGKYEAEATLINKSGINKSGIDKSGIDKSGTDKSGTDKSGTDKSGTDYLTWKSLKRNLPILAAKISEKVENRENFLRALSNEMWWQKNVVPTFAIAKEDAKEIFGVSKELQDAESTKIKDFVVKAAGSSKEEALKNLSIATSFLRSGAAYLALKDVIATYQIELLNSESEIAKNTSVLEIELTYLNNRRADLELLKAKFPGNSASIITQPMDSKDSSAKYLPIITQLIAVNKDISALKEDLSRLNNRKNQLAVMSSFLSQAKPVIDRNFDGLAAVAELMQIESSLRKDAQSSDWNKTLIFNSIKYDLALIHTRFTWGLEQPTFISTRKPHYLKHAAIGLAAGFFLALFGALCSVIWLRYRGQAHYDGRSNRCGN